MGIHILYYDYILTHSFAFCKRERGTLENNCIFRGVGTALVTPFKEGGIDFDAFGRLIDAQIPWADALIVAGTTGEAPTLSEAERDELLCFAIARTEGKLPIIMGTGSNDTRHAVHLTKRAAALGAQGALVVTPYYNRGTREGIRRHFLAVAEASDIPAIVYSVPSRTGCSLSLADYESILSHPNICGVKEAQESAEVFCHLASLGTAVYSGSDAFLLPALSLGAVGVISVLSNVLPRRVKAVIDAFGRGENDAACRRFADIAPLCSLLFKETSPAPVKEALRLLEIGDGSCRLPMTAPGASLAAELKAEISRLFP